MEEYKSNSNKSRQAEKHVEKVVSGGAKVKKKSGFQKFAAAFVQEDMASIRDYVLNDILIPYTKRTLLDALNNGVRMAFGMESGGRDNRSAKVSYRSYYDDNRSTKTQRTRRTGSDLDDIVLDNRGDAEEVLQQMDDLLDRYEAVSIADLYDLAGLKGTYTDNKYGWTDIRGARVVRVSDGYAIRMPRAVPL